MRITIRPRTFAAIVGFIAILGGLALTLPASGATQPTVVRLNLGSDGRFFEYGTTRQNLATVKSACDLTTATAGGPLIALTSTPSGGGARSSPGRVARQAGPSSVATK